ncbi:MAG: SufD family Fe-S cluster assembly protein [Candidatus Freyarchaeota archaeon]|nr:SufD family Fe-S cluster assembly protein [Candidatus Jordarchaeia archaeon]
MQEEEIRDRALKALDKKADYGPDVDLSAFVRGAGDLEVKGLEDLPSDVREQAVTVGVKLDMKERAGTYFQLDHSVIFSGVSKYFDGGVELISTIEAKRKYDWLNKYFWKVVPVDADKYTAFAALEWDHGYFLRVAARKKVTVPLQSCLYIHRNKLDQNVHNIILMEPGSEAQIITGCVVHPNVSKALHVGITEIYLMRGAKLTFTMIHNWAEGIDVRPRTGIMLEEGATFISNYINLKPVGSVQTYPAAHCNGENSTAIFNSLIYGNRRSVIDVGGKIILDGRGSRGEVKSRVIATGNAEVYSRGLLVGKQEKTRGHLECRGLLLSDQAFIHAIPELRGEASGTELSHEAAVGKIAEEAIYYLMARGFSEEEAVSMIVRGFLDTRIFGLPEPLQKEVDHAIDIVLSSSL